MENIKFKRDTSFRKQFFVPDSFAHPAKMDAQLLIWIVENYTQAGETILDPMAGSGTTMLACTLGRNCVLIELEEKFCKMMRDNWEMVRMRPQLGYFMGNCQIIQGDARNLEGQLADKIITSPPYALDPSQSHMTSKDRGNTDNPNYRPSWKKKIADGYCETSRPYVDKIVTSPPYAEGKQFQDSQFEDKMRIDTKRLGAVRKYNPENPSNIANLPYGEIDKCIFSPPYEEAMGSKHHSPRDDKLAQEKSNPTTYVDKIVTSPPYEHQIHRNSDEGKEAELMAISPQHYVKYSQPVAAASYIPREDNIGNLKGDTYLEAMLQVYQQCYSVLKQQGLMILVTKNFIRNKQVVRLDVDTIKLCEQAGFSFLESYQRKLPSQSFWRVIYHQKYPEVEQINYEDVLVFTRSI